jgi:hypothetical protein
MLIVCVQHVTFPNNHALQVQKILKFLCNFVHRTYMAEMNAYNFLSDNVNGRDQMEHLGVYGRNILN